MILDKSVPKARRSVTPNQTVWNNEKSCFVILVRWSGEVVVNTSKKGFEQDGLPGFPLGGLS